MEKTLINFSVFHSSDLFSDFKPDYVSDPIEIVDLYQIIAFLLKIPPNYHDGSWDRYEYIYRKQIKDY
jgi:hypothetical protein